MKKRQRNLGLLLLLITAILCMLPACDADEPDGIAPKKDKIGVIYVLHGGMDEYCERNLWDTTVQMFSYDPNHPVYRFVMWNPFVWSKVLQNEYGIKFIKKFEFEYERIGGSDPFHILSDQQLGAMKAALDKNTSGLEFEVDFACWMAGDRIGNYPYPRFIYNIPGFFSGYYPILGLSKVRYCGEKEADGPWTDCDPDRYDVDGPVERLLKKGVSRIIVIDMTVGAARFYKTYDVVQMTKRALSDWNTRNNTSVPLLWVNDYSNLMEDSYPEDEGWTPIQGPPEKDRRRLVNGRPNPVVDDLDYALLHVEGIEAGMSNTVRDADTGILLFNHGVFDENRPYFDPKIDDTVVLNENIKALMLERHPEMLPENIIGAYGGVKEVNPDTGIYERTRRMRGENLAHTGLLDSGKDIMGDVEWGYRYWDALEYLKDRGVKHIVISFPQVITDSVLTLVEYYNQVAKEIGIKTWLYYDTGDYDTYPDVGHPFAEYWGNWVDTNCGAEECCFEMGGCDDGRPYPPPRQQPLDESLQDMDPSLAYDLSDYGHLGYDPAKGPPDPNAPVQSQYTGTWAMYVTPGHDPRLGKILAKHVLNAVRNPMVHITNNEIKSISMGQSVTWQANVVNGTPEYTYEWFTKKAGASDWTAAGDNSASWTWTPGSREAGTYTVRCKVTDSESNSNEVTWEGFVVSKPE